MRCVGLLLLVSFSVCLAARGHYAQQLFRDLFVNYTSALRPVENTEQAINVTLQVTLSQIIDMDERNQILTLYLWVRQVWMDSFLTWSKDDYDGLESIRLPSRYVWKPDIVLYNSADDEFSSSIETNVALRSDGQLTWDQPSITKSSCSVDVAFFPFDLQQCVLTFGSWTHNGNQMDLNIELDSAEMADLVPNVEWQVLGMPAKKNVILYGCCSDPYPDITFTLQLKRRASFYIFNLLLPCMMISFLAPLGFYLPAESGEKVSLGVTVLLALTVFQLLVAESMPPSESVPLIGKYYIATMTMVTASTALTIFIMNLHHCGPEARPVPGWVRVLVLQYLNRVCLVYDLGETCAQPEDQAAGGANTSLSDEESSKHSDEVLLTVESAILQNGGRSRERAQEEANEDQSSENKMSGVEMHGEERLQNGGSSVPSGVEGLSGRRKSVDCVDKQKEAPASCCHCGRHLCPGIRGYAPLDRLRGDVSSIADTFQEQREAQALMTDWRRVGRVLDRGLMWLFFIMVFIMSVLILGKSI
uniref:Neuronal acetylcholine receptor subunit alpha-10-like n=1 Tax=Knipowitschia caucasica TaxID=637954 RepID=A0AAV2JBN3_KNICA